MIALFHTVYNALYSLWNQIIYAISKIRVFDVIDIIVVAYLLYKAFVFLKETRAGQLVKGIALLLIVYGLATWWDLAVLQWILSVFFGSAIVVFAVVFQPEIRRLLERVGQTKFGVAKTLGEKSSDIYSCVEEVGKAAGTMQKSKVGALVVFERKTQLGDIVNTGTIVDAVPTEAIINNIFYPKSPLHDGAVIIRDGRIYAAGCILPLTQRQDISASLGTRHRAAVGMTENSDAVVLVVSEETGTISVVNNGEIKRNFNGLTATAELMRILVDGQSVEDDSKLFSAIKSLKVFRKKDEEKSSESEAENNGK